MTVNGILDLSGLSSSNRFTINLQTLDSISPDNQGPAQNFNGSQNYTWTLASASSFNEFSEDKFNINTDNFVNSHPGEFSVALSGNNLNLVYTAPVPEPSTVFGISFGVLAVGTFVRRRFRKSPVEGPTVAA